MYLLETLTISTVKTLSGNRIFWRIALKNDGKYLVGPVIVAALLILLSVPLRLNASDVTDKLRSTIDGVIDILRDDSLRRPDRQEERRSRIRKLIMQRFSFEEMSKRSLARYWRERSDSERMEFVSLFSDLIENAYIEKIERYTDEEIRYVGERMSGERAEVKTIVMSKGTQIPIDYRLIMIGSDWMVYDIVIEGVSLVSNYRSQFSNTIRSSSYEDLVKKLKEKTGRT